MIFPTNNRMCKEAIFFFQDLHGNLTARGLNPNYMCFDNEASPSFQYLLKDKCIDYQLEPPQAQT